MPNQDLDPQEKTTYISGRKRPAHASVQPGQQQGGANPYQPQANPYVDSQRPGQQQPGANPYESQVNPYVDPQRPAQQPAAQQPYAAPQPAAPAPDKTMVAPGGTPKTQLRPHATGVSPYPTPGGAPYQQPYQQPYGADPRYAQPQQPYGQQPYGADPRYAQAAPSPSPAPVEAPRREGFSDDRRPMAEAHPGAVRAGNTALAVVCRVGSIVCRVAALLLFVLVVANAIVTGPLRIHLLELTAQVTGWIPGLLSGTFVIETPLGGNLRGDFVIASIVLFVIDWLLALQARRLRG